jgi:hypothetical protein
MQRAGGTVELAESAAGLPLSARFKRRGDRARHLHLRGAHAITVDLAREQAVVSEDPLEFGLMGRLERTDDRG